MQVHTPLRLTSFNPEQVRFEFNAFFVLFFEGCKSEFMATH